MAICTSSGLVFVRKTDMKRLTYWNEKYDCWSYHGPSGDAAKRLAAIENILGDEYDLERLRKLVEADREG